MNTMMMALLQGRLWKTAAQLQQRLQRAGGEAWVDDAAATELSEVLQALEAVERGRYGRCGECDRPLEVDELLARPHRIACADCEAQSSPARTTSRRLFTQLLAERQATQPVL